MNHLNYNIKNKIKQPAKCCSYCGKTYVKQNNLDKHIGICELIYNAKRKQCNDDYKNDDDKNDYELYSPQQLFYLLKELAYKYNQLEEKVKELTKNTLIKKSKINISSQILY